MSIILTTKINTTMLELVCQFYNKITIPQNDTVTRYGISLLKHVFLAYCSLFFAKKEIFKPCKQIMKTHVLILDSTAAWENPTDFTPVKARGALVVKAAAPATRERATANFIFSYTITSMTKSEQRRFFVVILSFELEGVDALSTSPAPIKYFGAKHACTKRGEQMDRHF